MKAAKSGMGRFGFDWNSGWNWTPRNQGWFLSSMISTRLRFGVDPADDQPALQAVDVGVVHLVAVAVALAHARLAVGLGGQGPGRSAQS
jgi:hypothetical protein